MKGFVTIIIVVLAMVFLNPLMGQDSTMSIPAITSVDMDYVFAQDTDAQAIILYDKGMTSFVMGDDGILVVFERTTRIKICDESGFDWGDVGITFINNVRVEQAVFDIKGRTYNVENGEIVSTELNGENTYLNIDGGGRFTMKFAMPAIKEGSVIEYSYKLVSDGLTRIPDWQFQHTIPTVRSEFTLRTVPFYEYAWLYQGAYKFETQESYSSTGKERSWYGSKFKDMINVFVVENILAYEDEDFVASRYDNICMITFQLSQINNLYGDQKKYISTWAELIDELESNTTFGKYVKNSQKLAKKYIDVDAIEPLDLASKVDIVIKFIKNNCEWSGYDGIIASKDPRKVLKEDVGSSAEINLLLTGFLQAVGVDAYPLILSTRAHGKVKYKYPFVHYFNYTIVVIETNKGRVLLDGTDILLQNNRIPEKCINGKGLIVIDGDVRWVNMESPVTSKTMTIIEINPTEELLNAKIAEITFEYDAYNSRVLYEDEPDVLVKLMNDKGYESDANSISFKNYESNTKPYSASCYVTLEAESFNGKIYIDPFLKETITENPFDQDKRLTPVDLTYKREHVLQSKIVIPEGYILDYTAEDLSMTNALYDFKYSTSPNNGLVTVRCSYSLKKPIYEAYEYEQLKMLYQKIIEKTREKVVLVKS